MTSALPRRAYVGLQLAPNLAQQSDPGSVRGLLVRAVAAGSSAESAGVLAGDRVLRIGQRALQQMDDARAALRGILAGEPLTLDVLRDSKLVHLETRVVPYPVESHLAARVELGTVPVSNDAGATQRLRAIVLLPTQLQPTQGFPVVYYLPGAHWASEEYPFLPLHPVPSLLGELAARGIASVRVERSGLGDSEGPPCTQTDFEAELEGYRAGYAWIARQAWADKRRLFLLGHSIGAMVAPLLAHAAVGVPLVASAGETLPLPRGVVTYGASAFPIADALVGALERFASLHRAAGTSTPQNVAHQAELLQLVVAGKLTPREALLQRPELRDSVPDHFTADSIFRRNVRFYHQLQAQPFAQLWRTLSCPLLALHGTSDWVSGFDDSRRLATLVPQGAARQVNADHQMANPDLVKQREVHAALALVPEIASLRLASELVPLIADWIVAQSGE